MTPFVAPVQRSRDVGAQRALMVAGLPLLPDSGINSSLSQPSKMTGIHSRSPRRSYVDSSEHNEREEHVYALKQRHRSLSNYPKCPN